jgi:hypothetical protein
MYIYSVDIALFFISSHIAEYLPMSISRKQMGRCASHN